MTHIRRNNDKNTYRLRKKSDKMGLNDSIGMANDCFEVFRDDEKHNSYSISSLYSATDDRHQIGLTYDVSFTWKVFGKAEFAFLTEGKIMFPSVREL